MARYTDPKCKLCRREGIKLFLKGERCLLPKCPIERKGAVAPGQHGARRARREASNFAIQLRAKQKAKRAYGVLEKQFRRYAKEAAKGRQTSGQTLLQILERRLDNAVYRLGFTPSRSVARQIVSHGHVLINSKRINIPSYLVKPDDLITLDKKAQEIAAVKKNIGDKKYEPPAWMERKGVFGKILRLSEKDEIRSDINEQLISEYYSRR